MKPTDDELAWMYERMFLSRQFEQVIYKIYLEGKQPVFNMANGPIPGEMHLSDGQEAVAAGVCVHLEPSDIVTATHRPHHQAIAKGVNLKEMAAEIFGKSTGLSGGRGGHMHLFDTRVHFACAGIIGQGMGPACGGALSRKLQGKPGVAVAFVGEGAVNQGAWHEAMNLAAVWKLPFICVIEDNQWAISVPKQASTAVPHNDVRAKAYGIPGYFVEKNDPYAIYAVAGEAIARARAGDGPSLIEIKTARLAGHFMGDAEAYRPKGEKEELMKNDPLPAMRARLVADGTMTEADLSEIEAKAGQQVDEAIAFARKSAEPKPEDALTRVFA